jgi:hypothetical protein
LKYKVAIPKFAPIEDDRLFAQALHAVTFSHEYFPEQQRQRGSIKVRNVEPCEVCRMAIPRWSKAEFSEAAPDASLLPERLRIHAESDRVVNKSQGMRHQGNVIAPSG